MFNLVVRVQVAIVYFINFDIGSYFIVAKRGLTALHRVLCQEFYSRPG